MDEETCALCHLRTVPRGERAGAAVEVVEADLCEPHRLVWAITGGHSPAPVRAIPEPRPDDVAEECHYCGVKREWWRMTWDHIVPRALRGPDALWNKVRACPGCNHAKADRLPTCGCERCQNATVRVLGAAVAGVARVASAAAS